MMCTLPPNKQTKTHLHTHTYTHLYHTHTHTVCLRTHPLSRRRRGSSVCVYVCVGWGCVLGGHVYGSKSVCVVCVCVSFCLACVCVCVCVFLVGEGDFPVSLCPRWTCVYGSKKGILSFVCVCVCLCVLSSVGQDHLNTTNTLAKCFTNWVNLKV